MNKVEFMEGIHLLQDNYNKIFSNSQLNLFYENLKDLSKDRFLSSIKRHIRTSTFMPTIADLRNEKRKEFANYEQRDYSDLDFESLYVNRKKIAKE